MSAEPEKGSSLKTGIFECQPNRKGSLTGGREGELCLILTAVYLDKVPLWFSYVLVSSTAQELTEAPEKTELK